MFESTIQFGKDINLPYSVLDKACISVIETIKKELPPEARVYSVICEILKRCKEEIDLKKIIL